MLQVLVDYKYLLKLNKMCSKVVLILIISALSFISIIDATCLNVLFTVTTTTAIPFEVAYHSCPKTQISYDFLYNNGPLPLCYFGAQGNACFLTTDCPSGKFCCQDENGCNQCIGNQCKLLMI